MEQDFISGMSAPIPMEQAQVEEKYAGFWIRWLALALDGLIFVIPSVILAVILPRLLPPRAVSPLIGTALSAWYYIWLHGTYGQTLGKRAFGIKVFQASGEPLTYENAFVRWLGTWVNMLSLGIGWLMVAFKSNKRGLHDVIADTKVVYIKKPSTVLIVVMSIVLCIIPVATVGILAAVAAPKFAQLINKSKEGATKGALSSIRSAMQVYYGDKEGVFPSTLEELTRNGQYISAIPVCKCPPHHPETAEIINITESDGENLDVFLRDTGKWLYMGDKKSKDWGSVVVDCTHTDSGGKKWSEY